MSDIRRLVEMMQQQMEAQRQQTEILPKQMLEQQGAQQKGGTGTTGGPGQATDNHF